jgi:hypothetical protein
MLGRGSILLTFLCLFDTKVFAAVENYKLNTGYDIPMIGCKLTNESFFLILIIHFYNSRNICNQWREYK